MQYVIPFAALLVLLVGWALWQRHTRPFLLYPETERQLAEMAERFQQAAMVIGTELVPAFQAMIPAVQAAAEAFDELERTWSPE